MTAEGVAGPELLRLGGVYLAALDAIVESFEGAKVDEAMRHHAAASRGYAGAVADSRGKLVAFVEDEVGVELLPWQRAWLRAEEAKAS